MVEAYHYVASSDGLGNNDVVGASSDRISWCVSDPTLDLTRFLVVERAHTASLREASVRRDQARPKSNPRRICWHISRFLCLRLHSHTCSKCMSEKQIKQGKECVHVKDAIPHSKRVSH